MIGLKHKNLILEIPIDKKNGTLLMPQFLICFLNQ